MDLSDLDQCELCDKWILCADGDLLCANCMEDVMRTQNREENMTGQSAQHDPDPHDMVYSWYHYPQDSSDMSDSDDD